MELEIAPEDVEQEQGFSAAASLPVTGSASVSGSSFGATTFGSTTFGGTRPTRRRDSKEIKTFGAHRGPKPEPIAEAAPTAADSAGSTCCLLLLF